MSRRSSRASSQVPETRSYSFMTPHDEVEYTALRSTIAQRGTARPLVFAAGAAAWAGCLLAVVAVGSIPLLTLVPLLVLAATFETVFSLHVGVERIGRYLQVFHEDRWEQTAMRFGAPLAGTGADPLFAMTFLALTAVNLVPMLLAGAVPVEWAGIGLAHALFLVRLLRARRAAGQQRASDLARFTALRQG